MVNAVVQNSPGLSWLRSSGYNASAIPPDLSANLNFEATPVQSNSPYVDEALAVADAVMAGAFQSIPGVMRQMLVHVQRRALTCVPRLRCAGLDQQFAQIEAAQIGPFKQSRSISVAPQIRFFFFRESFGLPQSPRQALQWLLDPTLQLVRLRLALAFLYSQASDALELLGSARTRWSFVWSW